MGVGGGQWAAGGAAGTDRAQTCVACTGGQQLQARLWPNSNTAKYWAEAAAAPARSPEKGHLLLAFPRHILRPKRLPKVGPAPHRKEGGSTRLIHSSGPRAAQAARPGGRLQGRHCMAHSRAGTAGLPAWRRAWLARLPGLENRRLTSRSAAWTCMAARPCSSFTASSKQPGCMPAREQLAFDTSPSPHPPPVHSHEHIIMLPLFAYWREHGGGAAEPSAVLHLPRQGKGQVGGKAAGQNHLASTISTCNNAPAHWARLVSAQQPSGEPHRAPQAAARWARRAPLPSGSPHPSRCPSRVDSISWARPPSCACVQVRPRMDLQGISRALPLPWQQLNARLVARGFVSCPAGHPPQQGAAAEARRRVAHTDRPHDCAPTLPLA